MLERLVARFESGMPQPRLMWEPPERPDYVDAARARHVGFRLTPTQVVAKRKLSQNKSADVVETIIAELERRRTVREPALAGRDAARARRQRRAVTRRTRRRRHHHRRPARRRGRTIRFDDDPVDVFLADGVIADIAPAGALRPARRGARRRRSVADPGTVGPPRPRRAVGARRAARAARARDSAAHAARIMARRDRSSPTAAGSATASATRCGPTRRPSPCSTRRPATCRPT